MRQIVLDTETTGLHVEQGHRIIEIGCLELIDRKLTGNKFHHYINPQREIEEGALAVHGISQDFLQSKPNFSNIDQEFIEFISGAELIIHNAPFDVGFLNVELQLAQKKWKSITDYCRVIDTLTIARELHMGQRNSLDALCKRYNIDNSHREYHGALLDAHLLAQVYLLMTGGQGSLFSDLNINEPIVENKPAYVMDTNIKRILPIIEANSAEIAAHLDYLEKLKKKNRCLWLG